MNQFKTRLTSQGRSAAIKRGLRKRQVQLWQRMVASWLLLVTIVIVSLCVFFNFFFLKFQTPVLLSFQSPVLIVPKYAQAKETVTEKKEPEALLLYKAQFKQDVSSKLANGKLTQADLDKRLNYIDFAWNQSQARGWKESDSLHLLKVLRCESGFDEYEDNINLHPQKDGKMLTTLDRGIAMWNDHFHPEVTDECVWNGECAINEMISLVQRDGNFGQWACDRLIK